MINFIISLVLGLLPEVLYFTLFLTYCKNLKEKRLKLFGLLALGYIALIMICRFQFIFYVAYIIYSYLVIKWLYKAHISDIFIISLGLSYMTIVAFLGYVILGSNYLVYYIVARICLYLPLLILSHKLNTFYIGYKSLWNRKDNAKIKSITLRNLSLVLLNLLVLLFNICAIWCSLYTP